MIGRRRICDFAAQVVGEDDYYGFNDDTALPDRGEADLAVDTIAGLFSGPALSG